MARKTEIEYQFELRAIITFSLDEKNEPTVVTVFGFGGMGQSAVRAIAQETLDTHFGSNYDYHGYSIQLTPDHFNSHGEEMVWEVTQATWRRMGWDGPGPRPVKGN